MYLTLPVTITYLATQASLAAMVLYPHLTGQQNIQVVTGGKQRLRVREISHPSSIGDVSKGVMAAVMCAQVGFSASRDGNFVQMGGRGGNVTPSFLDLDFFKSQGPHLMATAGSDGAVRSLA